MQDTSGRLTALIRYFVMLMNCFAMLLSSLQKKGLLILLLLSTINLDAQLKLSSVFSSNMVLQRNKPLDIWGKAAAGKEVTVIFSTQKKITTADASGKWALTLDPLTFSFVPQDLIVQSETTVTLHNILVGDVWLCTGQSNMEYPLDRKWRRYAAPKNGTDIAEAELRKPNKAESIRYLYVEKKLNKFPELPTRGWTYFDDTTAKYISAIGYFFAKEVYAETNVPIGIISSSWGGTRIEQWTPPAAYKQSTVFKDSVTSDTFRIDGIKPGQMYKGMIEPLIPFGIKGILWYQGESNCMIEDQATYPEKFKLFISSWRTLFKDNQLPLYTVQISPYLYSARNDPKKHSVDLLAKFWEAQTTCLKIPNIEMVVTTDLVDNLSDIHPSYKWIVGHRLALTALAKTYGKTSFVYSGPVYESMQKNRQRIELYFSNTGSGLSSSDGKPLNWFTVAGKDGKFIKADVVIEGNKLIVSSTEVAKPKHVRFAWNETAQPNFINKEGLPARPFRTDKRKID
jgi:sialate O-acetylesterase